MVIGIGCDMVNHDMTRELGWESDTGMLQRVFSQKELDLYSNHKGIKFIAGRFAAKEAVLKCLGTGMQDGISLTDIQILQFENGKPKMELEGEVKDVSCRMGISLWHISITHSMNYSLAFVIAEGDKL